MKRLSALLCTILLLCGCAAGDTQQTDPITITQTDPVVTTTPPTETASPTKVPAETVPAGSVPYTLPLGAAVPIFDGPSYDAIYLRSVGEDGEYTIVEEVRDAEGSLWGRLKSGAGWVDLTALDAETPVTAAFANEALLSGGTYHEFIAEDSEYLVRIVFRAAEPLTDVQFSLLELDPETMASYGVSESLYTLPALTPGTPFVAGVVFYGDLTAYGLSFTDEAGTPRHYAVTISGRNGSLVLEEYTP